MNIQSPSSPFFTTAATRFPLSTPIPNTRTGSFTTSAAHNSDSVHISQAARDALATSTSSSSADGDKSVEARLAAIRAKGGVNVSQEEHDFLVAHDKKLAEIIAMNKRTEELTADEIDYMQKATGAVNTFANLSQEEKALYDKAVASGDTEAAAGISLIAFTRMMGHVAGGADGTTYDPLNTKLTAENIEKFFRHSIIDSNGQSPHQFQALIKFLQKHPVT